MGDAMDDQGNRRKYLLRRDEIEAQAIEALERARLLPPGDRRHELLREAGKLRMQVMMERLAGEALGVRPKSARSAASRRRDRA